MWGVRYTLGARYLLKNTVHAFYVLNLTFVRCVTGVPQMTSYGMKIDTWA